MSEWLGSEIFRQAGYPAPRVGHVRLWINDRDLGLYVIREGFDDAFLKRVFGSADGNLFDGASYKTSTANWNGTQERIRTIDKNLSN